MIEITVLDYEGIGRGGVMPLHEAEQTDVAAQPDRWVLTVLFGASS